MKSLEEINKHIYENPQKQQIVDILRVNFATNEEVNLELTADVLMRGIETNAEDCAAIAMALEAWTTAKDEKSKKKIATDFAERVQAGGYLRFKE